jgi:O-antigen/teichoic acid export membrane protein
MLFIGIAAEPFVAFIFGEKYAGSGVVFAWLLVALASNLFFPHSLVMATGRVRVNVAGAIAELFINVTLSLLLVKDFGIAGVAFSSALAHWCYTVAMAVYCRVQLGVSLKFFLPMPLGIAFYGLLLISGVVAWLSLGFSNLLVLAFYVPVGILTLIQSKKFM